MLVLMNPTSDTNAFLKTTLKLNDSLEEFTELSKVVMLMVAVY
jgi:hypothetical protein